MKSTTATCTEPASALVKSSHRCVCFVLVVHGTRCILRVDGELVGRRVHRETCIISDGGFPQVCGIADCLVCAQAFIKKYIRYAKRQKPRLSDEASTLIASKYAELREKCVRFP